MHVDERLGVRQCLCCRETVSNLRPAQDCEAFARHRGVVHYLAKPGSHCQAFVANIRENILIMEDIDEVLLWTMYLM